jgi:hypothetical protein
MTLQTTRVIPDLIYYTQQYVLNSIANKSKIPFPPILSSVYLLDNKSFIRLLFDESWPSNLESYRYLYRQEIDTTSIPSDIFRRMMVYPASSRYFVCDSDSTSVCEINIFSLQEDDLTMLDNLLQYRLDSTSVTLISIDYNSLSTNLSKLIYIYLDFKINNNYEKFNITTPISSEGEVLENFYESFLIDTIFISLSSLGT